MSKKYNIHKYIKKVKVSIFVIIVFSLIIYSNKVNASKITITGPSKIEVGGTATIKVDFGTYIGAYDFAQLKYNTRILEYTGTEDLVSKCWFDNTTSNKGIRYKTFTFKGKKNGTATLNYKIQGVVSANATIDELGDFEKEVKIIVGDGVEAGDMNGDGFINSTDSAMVLDIYKNGGATQKDYKNGDINLDNVLNATDAAMILDIYKNS